VDCVSVTTEETSSQKEINHGTKKHGEKKKRKKRHEEEPTYFQKLRARNLILQNLRKLLETPIEATLVELRGERRACTAPLHDLCTPESADLSILYSGGVKVHHLLQHTTHVCKVRSA
jgi:hypothetical protein